MILGVYTGEKQRKRDKQSTNKALLSDPVLIVCVASLMEFGTIYLLHGFFCNHCPAPAKKLDTKTNKPHMRIRSSANNKEAGIQRHRDEIPM